MNSLPSVARLSLEQEPTEMPAKTRSQSQKSLLDDLPEALLQEIIQLILKFAQKEGLFDEMSAPELVEACLETLNTPPPRKKYAKKDPKPKYGILEHYKSQVVEKSGRKVLSTLLVTTNKKSKFFWGKG